MGKKCVINIDLADVWEEKGRKKLLRTIAWGDEVAVVKESGAHIEISTVAFRQKPDGLRDRQNAHRWQKALCIHR